MEMAWEKAGQPLLSQLLRAPPNTIHEWSDLFRNVFEAVRNPRFGAKAYFAEHSAVPREAFEAASKFEPRERDGGQAAGMVYGLELLQIPADLCAPYPRPFLEINPEETAWLTKSGGEIAIEGKGPATLKERRSLVLPVRQGKGWPASLGRTKVAPRHSTRVVFVDRVYRSMDGTPVPPKTNPFGEEISPEALKKISKNRAYQGVILHPSFLRAVDEVFASQIKALEVPLGLELSGKAAEMGDTVRKAWAVAQPQPLVLSLSDEELIEATENSFPKRGKETLFNTFLRAVHFIQGVDVLFVLIHGHEVNLGLVKASTLPLEAVQSALLAGSWVAAEVAARRGGLGDIEATPASKAWPVLKFFAKEYAAHFKKEKGKIEDELLFKGSTSQPLYGYSPVIAPVIWSEKLDANGYLVGLGDAIGAVVMAFVFEILRGGVPSLG